MQRKNNEKKVEEYFFIKVLFENLPYFCVNCIKFGHDVLDCSKRSESSFIPQRKGKVGISLLLNVTRTWESIMNWGEAAKQKA